MTVIAATPITRIRMISWSTTTLPNGTVIQAGMIVPDASVEERHDDDSVITENPVENGSVVNDHAYDTPQELELTYAWAAGSPQANGNFSFLNQMYAMLLTLKQAKVLLNIVTGKRQYQNVLIKSLSETTDKDTENVLLIRIGIRQLLLAVTQTVLVPLASQQSIAMQKKGSTLPTIHMGTVNPVPGTNFNTGTPSGS
jgi:hypothetical protein